MHTIRPIEPEDAPALVQFHSGLSRETIRRRFFTAHPELSVIELERFTHVDHHAREALVVLDDEGLIIGVGRFDRLDDTTDAEVAFVVADGWQHHGIATDLLHRLAIRAREEGLTRLVASTLAENTAMLAVFEHSGWVTERTFDHGVVSLAMVLDEVRSV